MYKSIYDSLENFDLKSLKKGKSSYINHLKKLNIFSLYDLIYFFPKSYENKAKLKKISDIKNDENVIIEGSIVNTSFSYFKRNMIKVILCDIFGDCIELIWFNSPYLKKNLVNGMKIRVIGKVRKNRTFQMVNPKYVKIEEFSDVIDKKNDGLDAIYSLTKGLTQEKLASIIKEAISKYLYLFNENLPKEYILENRLFDRTKAIVNLHNPKNLKYCFEAKRRIIYEEALIFELKILKTRYIENLTNRNKYYLDNIKTYTKEYVSSLPFELTKDQKKVIKEIYDEINSGKIINRLIQGDVGSGKTIVALILLLYMAENGYQGVIMAPTEILAKQHYENVKHEFEKLNIKIEILTGSTKAKEKERIYEQIKNNEINILVGTHSLLSDDLIFAKLGLIIIDEQHKFGVNQRNALREKAFCTNLIVMSATPIPRSLALTIYGDLDISSITSMPSGRKEIKTKCIKNDIELSLMHDFISKEIKKGRQIYIVSPLIEESKKLNLSSAISTYEKYLEIFPNYTIALLHGKLSSKEKNKVMEEFNENKVDILISTSVIEVGVNVVNASVIVILNAERFGLSSLHQLRGRVGRGKYNSYCFLVSSSDNEISKERLEVMEKTLDGFLIAKEDLRLRDTGEIFGMKQSGLSELKVLDIIENTNEIMKAKNFAMKYLEKNKGKILIEELSIDLDNMYNKTS